MQLSRWSAAALAVVSACTSGPSAPDPRLPGPLRAAAAVRPLDEPVGIPTSGYTQDQYLGRPFPADEPGSPFADIFPATRGVQTQPMAKALALDNGRWRLVLVKIDAVYITAVLTERVLQLAREAGLGDLSGKLILQATHTHAAGSRFSRESLSPPALGSEPPLARHALAHGGDTFSQELTDRIAASIVLAIGDALAHLVPARLGTASTDDTTAGHDRRCENDWITGGPDHDSRVTVLRVEAQDGAPIAALFHYAMHGTISGSSNRLLSVDAPGAAELAVEQGFAQPVVAMYLQGSAGDASPSGGGNQGAQAMQHVGADLAAAVSRAWADAGAHLQDSLVLHSLERLVPISRDGLGYTGQDFPYPDGAVLCQAIYTPACPGTPIPPSQVICVGPGKDGLGKYSSRVVAARVGDLGLLTLPGEPVTAVGRALREAAIAAGIPDAIVLGYAQDHDGYLLFDDDWLSGGYEPTISFWGWKYGRFIVDQGADAMRELLTGAAARKLPAPAPTDPTPLAYVPTPATDSVPVPAVTVEPAAQAQRLTPVRASFLAGDPALGSPEVRLQRDGGAGQFADVLVRGWIPVSSLRGDLPLFYTGAPTFKAAPQATARAHLWETVYEPPIDLPAGSYRLHLTGRARVAGQTQALELSTQPFAVQANTQLSFDTRLAVTAGTLRVDALPLYPARRPVFAPEPSGDWQLDGFLLVDPRYASPFAPASPGTASVAATLAGPAGPQALSLSPVALPWPGGVERFAPGEGPGLRVETPVSTGRYTLSLAQGAFRDAFGNESAAASAAIDVP